MKHVLPDELNVVRVSASVNYAQKWTSKLCNSVAYNLNLLCWSWTEVNP